MISEATRANLRAELAAIRERLAAVEPLKRQEAAIIALLGAIGESPEQPTLLSTSERRNPAEYAGLGVTEGVDAVLRNHLEGEFLTPREIMLELQAGGLQSDSKHLRTMIANACSRKARATPPEYDQGEKDGSLAFRLTTLLRMEERARRDARAALARHD